MCVCVWVYIINVATKNGAICIFFLFFSKFTGHRFPSTYSWRINLCEWHSQRTSRLLPELATAFLVPPGGSTTLLARQLRPACSVVSRPLSFSHSCSSATKDGRRTARLQEEARKRLLSCVSDLRCGPFSPAALSCSLRYRLGYVYDSSWSLKAHK